jgi:hypothetical protein
VWGGGGAESVEKLGNFWRNLMMSRFSQFCREKDLSLSPKWEAFFYEYLPADQVESTHVRIVGSVPKLIMSGKDKGRKAWGDDLQKKEFVFSIEENDLPQYFD